MERNPKNNAIVLQGQNEIHAVLSRLPNNGWVTKNTYAEDDAVEITVDDGIYVAGKLEQEASRLPIEDFEEYARLNDMADTLGACIFQGYQPNSTQPETAYPATISGQTV